MLMDLFSWQKGNSELVYAFGIAWVPFTPSECEATAMMHALKFALSNGFERVIFESDCKQVVNALRNDCLYANELGSLLSTCSSLLISNVNYNMENDKTYDTSCRIHCTTVNYLYTRWVTLCSANDL